MVGNENRRRKKTDAKRRRNAQKKREVSRRNSAGVLALMTAAAKWPVVVSKVTADSASESMKSAAIARKGASGQFAAVVFLVDMSCLGVKDVITICSASEWSRFFERTMQGPTLTSVAPEYICKLVLESVDFARSVGLGPHADFARAAPILSDLDPSQCLTEFEFGHEGTPHYIAGPHDSRIRQRQVLETLRHSVGEGNFHHTLRVDEAEFSELEFEDDPVRLIDGANL